MHFQNVYVHLYFLRKWFVLPFCTYPWLSLYYFCETKCIFKMRLSICIVQGNDLYIHFALTCDFHCITSVILNAFSKCVCNFVLFKEMVCTSILYLPVTFIVLLLSRWSYGSWRLLMCRWRYCRWRYHNKDLKFIDLFKISKGVSSRYMAYMGSHINITQTTSHNEMAKGHPTKGNPAESWSLAPISVYNFPPSVQSPMLAPQVGVANSVISLPTR